MADDALNAPGAEARADDAVHRRLIGVGSRRRGKKLGGCSSGAQQAFDFGCHAGVADAA